MALTFPSSPTTGQTYSYQGKTWQYNGTGWRQITGSGPGIAVQIFTANGTYTPAVGARYIIVEVQGAGGGSGGINDNASSRGMSGGGGAGGYAKKLISDLETSYSVVIGDPGVGGDGPSANNGGNGGDTYFGNATFLCANGGLGGSGDSSVSSGGTYAPGGAGGNATGGDINLTGEYGQEGAIIEVLPTKQSGAFGGRSLFGTSVSLANAEGYGAGGCGQVDTATASNVDQNGNYGAPGIIVVTEFLGEAYGAFTSDQHAIGDISVTFDATVKAGHVELDGSTITDGASDYPILATRYPWMVSGNDLILPDTRGRALRGWDHGAGTDPGAGSRTARAGDGATGDNPGTYQADAFQGHRHASLYQAVVNTGGFPIDNGGPGSWSSTSTFVANPTTDGTNGTPRTSSETRMININVTFQMRII